MYTRRVPEFSGPARTPESPAVSGICREPAAAAAVAEAGDENRSSLV